MATLLASKTVGNTVQIQNKNKSEVRKFCFSFFAEDIGFSSWLEELEIEIKEEIIFIGK